MALLKPIEEQKSIFPRVYNALKALSSKKIPNEKRLRVQKIAKENHQEGAKKENQM